ncbi:hypothetical protein HGRIS_004233 [Hohenbuehelia grisea]|uniref:Uncharacterized protein n=1 Tax=Hohenbuehelia grisea TaxID=104357 RepID=A0ABR3IP68_9AGAR
MSTAQSFARAMSPTMEGLTTAVVTGVLNGPTGDNAEATKKAHVEAFYGGLIAKLAAARSVDDIIDQILLHYRAPLRESLLRFASWVDKRETTRASLSKLETAVNAKNVPQRLVVKAPVFQLTQEFRESGSTGAQKCVQGFRDAEALFQESIVNTAVTGKRAELDFWSDKTNFETHACDPFLDAIDELYEQGKNSHKRPTIISSGGQTHVGSWTISPQFTGEYQALQLAVPCVLGEIVRIVELRHRAMNVKFETKKQVADKADVEMADATRPGPSMQSLVDKMLTACIKKLNLSTGKAKKATSSSQGSSKTSKPPPKPSHSGPKQNKARQNAKDDAKKKGKGKASPGKPDRKGKGRAT